MPANSSPLDVILMMSLFKSCTDKVTVITVQLANLSFPEGQVPACSKTVALKKSGAEHTDPVNYRLIANLYS